MNAGGAEIRKKRYIESDGVTQLGLSMAVNDTDHLKDLVTGITRPDGILLNPMVLSVEEIFYRFTYHQEWDVSEMSFAKYVSLTAAGNAPMLALPVFPSRVFRHSAIYVKEDSGIKTPGDIEGKTVGIPEWAQTAGVYVRGFLADYYDVDIKSINWVQAGVNQPGRKEKVRLSLPDGITYASRPDSSLNGMLQAGEIDVAITARPPDAFHDRSSGVRRLFEEPRVEEMKYYRESGIFPIMHVIVMRRDVFEANRWIAANLYKAFNEAKERSVRRLKDITASSVPLPGLSGYVEDAVRGYGEDLWPYGMEENRPTLEAFCRYTYDQGVAGRHLAIEDLFPPEVHASFKI